MFKKFKLIDVLNVERANCIPSKGNLIDGNIPYVTRSAVNNGKTCTCGNIEKINKGNCISVGGEGGAVFYQPVDWVAGNNMCRLWRDGLEMEHYLYIVGKMSKITNIYSYSNARTQEKIKKETLYLPVIENSNPNHEYTVDDIDWEYMRERITELERERITELDAYLKATGLEDYELTAKDKEILSLSRKSTFDEEGTLGIDCEDGVRFGEFNVSDIYEVQKVQHKLDKMQIEAEGIYPCFSSDTTNNGILGYTNNPEFHITNEQKVYIIFGDHTRTFDIATTDFSVLDNVKVLKPISNNIRALQYINSVWSKSIPSLGYARHWSVAKNKKLLLPIKSDGTPDFDYMEQYIRAMEKIVISDVVKYLLKEKYICIPIVKK